MRERFSIHRILAAAAVMAAVSTVVALPPQKAPAAKAYVGLFKENAIGVLDTSTDKVMRKIPIPPGPHGLAMTPDGKRLYASSDGDSTVSVIDTSTDAVIKTLQVGSAPHGLAMTPDGSLVLAAVFGANKVVFIDTGSDTIVAAAPAPNPHNIAITPDGRTAYVAAQTKGSFGLVVLDVPTRSRTAFVPLDKMPRALSVSPDGGKLYFTLAGSDSVQVLSTGKNTIVAQIPVGASPHLPLFTPDGRTALVVSQGPGELYFIDASKNAVLGSTTVGKLPHWIAVSPDGKTAYVTNEGSNDLTVVDIATRTATATVPMGEAPRKIVLFAGAGTQAMMIGITGFAFVDDAVRIQTGQAVTWVNHDSVPHTVTADSGAWTSGELQSGQSFTRAFNTPGVFPYHCAVHPAMTGMVTVGPAS